MDELLQEALDGMGFGLEALTKSSLEEFERDMDTLSAGLDHLPSEYRGTYSREDIYLEHD